MNEQEPLYITLSKQQCMKAGMDPNEIVSPKQQLSDDDFHNKRTSYQEIMEVVSFFSEKLLLSLQNTPILICISDSHGYLLDLVGDELIKSTVDQLGIKPGSLFKQEDIGTNVVSLALKQRHPVRVVGTDHYHTYLHGLACYGVPFHYTDEDSLLGAVCIMVPIEYNNSLYLPMLIQVVDSIERELLLRKQNRKLNIYNQVLLSRTSNGIIISDENGLIIEFTEFASHIFHGSKETYVQTSIFDLSIIGDFFKRVIKGVEIYDSKEVVFPREEGDSIICLFDAHPIYEGNKLIGAYGQLRDITERFFMEEKIKTAEKQVLAGRIAAGIAHEIRNPLTTVRGYLQFLEKDVGGKTGKLFSSLLIPEIDRANKIITDFLSIAKPSYRELDQIQIKEFFWGYLWNFLKSEALLYNVKLDFKIPSYTENLYILCNREELLQVFINLFQNSIQAKGDSSLTVTISTKVQNNQIHIEFCDNGKGISSSLLTNIFEPFFSTKDMGTGLGLSVSQKIIENHSGQMTAKSVVNLGTTFIITLPIYNGQ